MYRPTHVEEVVHPRPLLQEVNRKPKQRPVHQLGNQRRPPREALQPRSLPRLVLLRNRSLHLLEVVRHQLVVRVVLQAAQPRQRRPRLLPAVLAREPARRLGREQDANAKRQREGDAQADDDAPRGVVLLEAADAVVDGVCDEDADGDHELVGGDDGAADLARAALGLEHGDADGEVADAEAGDEPAHHEVHPRVHGGDLDDVADDEDGDAEAEAAAAAPPVGCVGAGEGADERADGHEGDDEGGDDGLEGFGAVRLGLAEAVDEVGEEQHAGDLSIRKVRRGIIGMDGG